MKTRFVATPLLRCLLLLLVFLALPAHAATYAFKSDTYAWETASNVINWDSTCTQYPDDDDAATITFSGGFTFTFAGTAYTSVRVLSNGMLQFGSDTGLFRDYTNDQMPLGTPPTRSGCTASTAARVIAAYWTDLNPGASGSGNVTWQQKGTAPNRYVVVSWNNVYQYGTRTPYTFQVILYENGEFKFQYGNANASGSNATIGVQVSSTDYTQYSYNSGYNANGSAIRWFLANTTPTRVADYRMDELSWSGAVGEVLDSSGNGHNGTPVGAAANVAGGYICRGLDIPANTSATTMSAVDTAVPVASLLGAQGGISMWVRSDVVWTNNTAAMLFDATTSASRPFFLMRSGGGALKFSLTDTNGTVLSTSSSAQAFAANAWVHVAATWRLNASTNGSVLRIYVNGVQVAVTNGTTSGSLHGSISTLFLGDNRTSGVTPSGGSVNSANGTLDEARIYNYEMTAVELAADLANAHGCTPPLHHIELRGSATGLTCTPVTWTVVACQDAACSALSTSGASGTLSTTPVGIPAPTVIWPSGSAGFTIPAGSSTATVSMQLVSAGSVTMGTSGVSPSPSSGSTCSFTGAASAGACTYAAADSGLLIDVPNHLAEATQPATVKAVKKSDTSTACVPAFASTTKTVSFTCSYANPTTGTLPLRLSAIGSGGTVTATRALNSGNSTGAACDATGQSLALYFDASGKAAMNAQYADVGQLNLVGTYTGSGSDAGLSITGSDSIVVAPASLTLTSLVPSGNIKAGNDFSATVNSFNGAGAATPNFGKESPRQVNMAINLRQPSNGSNAGFSASFGSFSAGSGTATMSWANVGEVDLVASATNYLGSAYSPSVSTVITVVPHHFDVVLGALPCGTFAYAGLSPSAAGQTLTTTVTAANRSSVTTTNYDGALLSPVSRNVTLSDANGVAGSFNTGPHATSASFTGGVASSVTANYRFTAKLTAESNLRLRATDTAGVDSSAGAEPTVPMRSGRLRLFNTFGSEKSPLQISMQAEYWSGSAWMLNSADACTSIPASAVALSNYRDSKGAAGAWTTTVSSTGTLVAGRGTLTLAAPSGGSTGTVDLAVNLGSGVGSDQSCLATHPSVTGANATWLRSQNGSCSTAWDRDPSARATFGIYSPETKKTVHVREIF